MIALHLTFSAGSASGIFAQASFPCLCLGLTPLALLCWHVALIWENCVVWRRLSKSADFLFLPSVQPITSSLLCQGAALSTRTWSPDNPGLALFLLYVYPFIPRSHHCWSKAVLQSCTAASILVCSDGLGQFGKELWAFQSRWLFLKGRNQC